MLDHLLRNLKDRLLYPLAQFTGRYLTPTAITVLAFVIGLGSAACLVQQQYGWGLLLWLLNRVFDGLDGAVARQTHQQSDFGGYLDILLDFAIYAFIPVAIVYGNPSSDRYLALTFLLTVFYVNAASWMYLSAILEKRASGAAAQGELTTVSMPTGLIGGAETILFFCAFLIWPQYIIILFSVMTGLTLLTIIQRLVWAYQHLDHSEI